MGTSIGIVGNNIKSGSNYTTGYTGHADVAGLKAIGWTDEDIAYFQQNGVDWNEEDDDFFKVPEENIALYKNLNVDNISQYKNILYYLPKGISMNENCYSMFNSCFSLIGIPSYDFRYVTNADNMFANCYALKCIPPIKIPSNASCENMFYNCKSLTSLPEITLGDNVSANTMFTQCAGLKYVSTIKLGYDVNINSIFAGCHSLLKIANIIIQDSLIEEEYDNLFSQCYALKYINIDNTYNTYMTFNYSCLGDSIVLTELYISMWTNSLTITSELLKKESLLYLINKSYSVSSLRIKKVCYDKYSSDPDVLEALANHKLTSLVQI